VKSAAAAVSYEQRDQATRKEEAGRVDKAREVVNRRQRRAELLDYYLFKHYSFGLTGHYRFIGL
jgi:hypothetical protein